MAANKTPSKSTKTPTKTTKGKDMKKLRRKKRVETYSIYVYKVLKNIHPDVGISKKSMSIMNDMVHDLFERIAQEAGKLARVHGKHTMSSHEVQCAVKLVLPGDLAQHAVSEGKRALTKFGASKV